MTEKPRTGNQQGTSRKERGPMTLGGDNSVSLLRVRVGADEGGRELGGAQDSLADTRQHPQIKFSWDVAQDTVFTEVATVDSYHQEKRGYSGLDVKQCCPRRAGSRKEHLKKKKKPLSRKMSEAMITSCGWRCWKEMNQRYSQGHQPQGPDNRMTPGKMGWPTAVKAGKIRQHSCIQVHLAQT